MVRAVKDEVVKDPDSSIQCPSYIFDPLELEPPAGRNSFLSSEAWIEACFLPPPSFGDR